MARAIASTVVDQDPDVVWEALRDFTCVGRWIPGARSCVLVPSESPTNPHRRIVLGDGTSLDERLVTLDEPCRRVRYTIAPPLPRPMRSFLGTARLLPNTDGNRTFIEWTNEFDAARTDRAGTGLRCEPDHDGRPVQRIREVRAGPGLLLGRHADRPGLGTPAPALCDTMYPFAGSGPYHCVILGAGAIDTKGGPWTDCAGRVLTSAGQPVPRLFGAGNCVASPSGQTYWGPGCSIGLAITFGSLAGRHAAAEAGWVPSTGEQEIHARPS